MSNHVLMIQFHQVKKEYPGNDFALGEVSFVVDEGEFVFLIGPSGSGKTTLIKLLIREENPTSGKIFLDDYDITKLSRSNVYKLRRQIGVIFQDYKLIPDKNAYENVAFAMEAAGRSTKDIKETVPYVLDIVGLKHRMSAFPEQLSGGEKQRVAIARAVANNPRVLIADEPTGNLDPGAAWDIVQILSKINNWGTTVIMSTHGSDIVNTLNKRVIQMRDGVVVRDDKKGGYEKLGKAEQSDQIDVSKSEDLASLYAKDEKKGPIQVKIKPKNEEAPEARKSFMSWFKFGKNPEQLEAKPLVLQKQDMTSGLQQEAAEAAAELGDQDIDAATAQEIIADADNTSVAELDLRPEVVADLQVAGYNDVEDVISAGPEQLADELIIDPEEVVLVAKAVSEFVEEEEEKIEEHERKPKANKSDKDEKKSKSEKVKIDLTGKK